MFCGLHQDYVPKELGPRQDGMCRAINSRKERCKFKARPNGFCGFHHLYRKVKYRKEVREKKKSEEDSASSTTSDSTTDGLVEVSGSLRKKARHEHTQCMCAGTDETQRDILWPGSCSGPVLFMVKVIHPLTK